MKLLESDAIINHIQSLIHENTQKQTNHFDLTVDSIARYQQAGQLDFGGSEFQPASTVTIDPVKKNKDDDYGWWNLERGSYRANFNEQLDIDSSISFALITGHSHAHQAGLITNSRIIMPDSNLQELYVTLQVPEAGVHIKENARIAQLHLFSN